jgi:hypothetical protein
MKLLICGSRGYEDYEEFKKLLFNFDIKSLGITEIIHGGAKGVDTLAGQLARELGIKETVMKPDWRRYGKKAGPMRNSEMVVACDGGIAFWDGRSPGTKDSITKLRLTQKLLTIIYIRR